VTASKPRSNGISTGSRTASGSFRGVIRAYRNGEEYRSTVGKIGQLESDCDGIKRDLGALVTGADGGEVSLKQTWIRLHADRMLELFGHLDSTANAAEQFAEELAAIAPQRRSVPLEGLARMAELAVASMTELSAVVGAFVRALSRPDFEASITEGVSTIRTLEAESDTVRNCVIEAAFDGDGTADSVAYRQLAVLLDAVPDAMEDVTDQMHLMTGSEDWLDIEIYPKQDYRPV